MEASGQLGPGPIAGRRSPFSPQRKPPSSSASFLGVSLTRGGSADSFNTFILAGLYVVCSVAFVCHNKYLMDFGRFPHPTHLVWFQCLFISCSTAMLLAIRPNLFPALSSSARNAPPMSMQLVCSAVLPVSLLLTGSLVLSNAAYLHSSLSFLQMMRGGGVVFSYILALSLMGQSFSWSKVAILTVVLGATALIVSGESVLNLLGFGMQILALLCESLRGNLQPILLRHARWRVDALTYVLCVVPICMILLTFVCAAKDIFGLSQAFAGPKLLALGDWAPQLLGNACLAFLSNMLSSALVEHASATGFTLALLVRDVLVVCVAVGIFQEAVDTVQGLAFCLQLAAVVTFAFVKSIPTKMPEELPLGNEEMPPNRQARPLAESAAPPPPEVARANRSTAQPAQPAPAALPWPSQLAR